MWVIESHDFIQKHNINKHMCFFGETIWRTVCTVYSATATSIAVGALEATDWAAVGSDTPVGGADEGSDTPVGGAEDASGTPVCGAVGGSETPAGGTDFGFGAPGGGATAVVVEVVGGFTGLITSGSSFKVPNFNRSDLTAIVWILSFLSLMRTLPSVDQALVIWSSFL